MESGRIKVVQQKKSYDFEIKGAKVFATCNEPARHIGVQVWKQHGDTRDVISIGKLVCKSDGPEQIAKIMNTMMKYGKQGEEEEVKK